ncbi:YhdP family phospholipid transporter [Thioalkalivibrio sp. HK1]|uniref:YhdP family phospholipid transporter n=1 Tax=Thioalkalivibrio sp. HK1 TaxID=1469245 RepID=UPI0004725073|nr:AsmA-like C-terminal region-containing protein [Thioalkalivibrio sp. HK1]
MNSKPSPAPPSDPDPATIGAGRKKAKRGSARRWAAYLGGFFLLIIGALLLLTEYMLSQADEYRPTIEGWVSKIAGESIAFEAIRIHRRGFHLAFELDDLRVVDRAGDASPASAPLDAANATPRLDERLRLDSITFVIDPIRTLIDATPRVHGITLDGLAFPFERTAGGEIVVAGHRLPTTSSGEERGADAQDDAQVDVQEGIEDRALASSLEPLLAWLSTQPDLTFDNSTITLRSKGRDLPLFFERIRIERASIEGVPIEGDPSASESQAPARTMPPIADADAWRIVGTLFPQPLNEGGDNGISGVDSKGMIDFSANLHGDSLSSWTARIEAQATGLRLESLHPFIPGLRSDEGSEARNEGEVGDRLPIIGNISGEISGNIRMIVQDFDLVQSQGKASLRSLRSMSVDAGDAGSQRTSQAIESSPSPSPPPASSLPRAIDGSFSFERKESGWLALFDDLSFVGTKDTSWALGSLEIELSPLEADGSDIGEGLIDDKRAPDLGDRASRSSQERSSPTTPNPPLMELSLLADRMGVDDLLSLYALAGGDPSMIARIKTLGIEGHLNDIRIRLPVGGHSVIDSPSPVGEGAKVFGLRASASFGDIGIAESKAGAIVPYGFEGRIELDRKGKIVAHIEDGEVGFSFEYRTPPLEPLRDFSGRLAYIPPSSEPSEKTATLASPAPPFPVSRPAGNRASERIEGGLVISNLLARSGAGGLKAEGRVHLPHSASSLDGSDPAGMRFGLRLELADGHLDDRTASLQAVRGLLPEGVVPEPVDRWIDSSMPRGDIKSARLTIEGVLTPKTSTAKASSDASTSNISPERDFDVDPNDRIPPAASNAPAPFAFTIEDRNVEAVVDLALPDFAYAPKWPAMSDIVGQVRFDNARMEARIDEGRIFGSTLGETRVVIDNMRALPPLLDIAGTVEGPIADGIRYLAESPLQKNFAPMSKNLAFDGRGSIALDIEVPLGRARKTRKTKTRGEIHLARTGVDIKGFAKGLQAVEGTIRFEDNRIEANDLKANYLGRAIRIAIDDSPTSGGQGSDPSSEASDISDAQRTLRIAIDGHSPTDHMLLHLRNIGADLPGIPQEKDGPSMGESTATAPTAYWQAWLEIPRSLPRSPGDDGQSSLEARLRLRSDLAGLPLDLPEPFGKDANSIRQFSLDDRFTVGQRHDLHLRYADRAQARLLLSPADTGLAIEGGEIFLGRKARSEALDPDSRPDADPTPPSAPRGIRIEGDMPILDLERWQRLLALSGLSKGSMDPPSESAEDSSLSPASSPSENDSAFDIIDEVDLDIERLFIPDLRRPFRQVRLHAEPVEKNAGSDATEWMIALESEHIEGWLRLIDAPGGGRRIRAEFERLSLMAGDAAEIQSAPDDPSFDDASTYDARADEAARLAPPDLPPTELLIRRLLWGASDLGAVDISTSRDDTGVLFRHFRVRNEDFGVDGIGSWKIDAGEVQSEFAGQLRGDDLGRIIDRIGLDGRVVERGKSELTFHGLWTGSPMEVDFERISGIVSLQSGPGRLRNVDRGLFARFFSLLILESLPRRLLFDFDDLFQEGLDYDRLSGEFRIGSGGARTGDLMIESETVRLTVTGRIDLVEENYDLVVTLVPKITSALPLTPLRLGEGLLGKEIVNRFFSYRYSIRGGWDDPIIEAMQ